MSFSSYLVGTYEKRFGIGTTLQIINPTTENLDVIAAFFDADEEFQKYLKKKLTPNDLWEIVVPVDLKELAPNFGVVKIISHRDGRTQLGIVGFQRQVLVVPRRSEIAFSEAGLAAVPHEFAQREYDERIAPHC